METKPLTVQMLPGMTFDQWFAQVEATVPFEDRVKIRTSHNILLNESNGCTEQQRYERERIFKGKSIKR